MLLQIIDPFLDDDFLSIGWGTYGPGDVIDLKSQTFPAAHWVIPAALTDIPQSEFTANYQAGKALLIVSLLLSNSAQALRAPNIRLFVDGVQQPYHSFNPKIPITGQIYVAFHTILTLAAGNHTIKMQAQREIDATQTIFANYGIESVINFPNTMITP